MLNGDDGGDGHDHSRLVPRPFWSGWRGRGEHRRRSSDLTDAQSSTSDATPEMVDVEFTAQIVETKVCEIVATEGQEQE